jgi:hypothetical protein
LAGCEETVLSETVCGGILDPNQVVNWIDPTKRLLRFRVDPAELRSEVPAVADGLYKLLVQVELPESTTAEELTIRFISRLVDLRMMLSLDVEAAYAGDPAANGYDEIVVAYPAIRVAGSMHIARTSRVALVGVPVASLCVLGARLFVSLSFVSTGQRGVAAAKDRSAENEHYQSGFHDPSPFPQVPGPSWLSADYGDHAESRLNRFSTVKQMITVKWCVRPRLKPPRWSLYFSVACVFR